MPHRRRVHNSVRREAELQYGDCARCAGGPVYTSIVKAVTENLSPTEVELIDDSASHAGHAGMKVVPPETWKALELECSHRLQLWLPDARCCVRGGGWGDRSLTILTDVCAGRVVRQSSLTSSCG